MQEWELFFIFVSLDESDTRNYYIWGLENKQFVVASSNGAYVYHQDDQQAVAHVEAMLKAEGEEIIAPYYNKRFRSAFSTIKL